MVEQIEITYGDKIFKLTTGQKITFKGGKVMQSDIVAKAVEGEEVTLISFTIGGTPYQAVEGMTWQEWCDSEYNTGGYYIDGNFVRPMAGIVVTNANSNVVSPSLTIINGYAYNRMAAGGADD